LDRVDERDLVSAARRRPELVERRDGGAGDLVQAVLELLPRDPELLRDLSVRRRPHELALEDGDRALDLPGPRPDGTWHPVERPQLVDDRAADPGHGERLELDLAVGVEPLDRPDQTEQAVRDEVLLVDVRGEARADAAGDELDERRVREDETVAEPLVSRLPVVLPERLSVG